MYVETAIIGGGFAGLNLALMLHDKGVSYIVLEQQDQILTVWKKQRWNAFEFNTPHEFNRLFHQVDDIPDEQCGQDFQKQIKLWDDHVLEQEINVRTNQKIQRVTFIGTDDSSSNNDGPRFSMEIESTVSGDNNQWTLTSRNVVCCTGAFNVPISPRIGEKWPGHIIQLHSADFKGPEQFPDNEKAILVVGSGQSGCQIADVLSRHGKKVWLASGNVKGVPRMYRGKHMFHWFQKMGMDHMTAEMLTHMPNGEEMRYAKQAQIGSVAPVSYFSLARQGVTILGRLDDVVVPADGDNEKARILFKEDRIANVQKAVAAYEDVSNKIKGWISKQDASVLALIPEETPETSLPEPEWEPVPELLESNGPLSLPLNCQGVIWCTGFGCNARTYLPETVLSTDLDERTQAPNCWKSKVHPGLYYAGFPWIRTFTSTILSGIRADGKVIVDDILETSPPVPLVENNAS